MAKLPHFKNSKAAIEKWEPVYKNLFEVTIIPPAAAGSGELLLEHVISINGLNTEKGQEAIQQSFKFAKRSYLDSNVPDTSVDIDITFSLNLNSNNQMYVYKTLRDWKRLGYNPLTGEMGLKKDYADGKIIVTMYNRVGDIYWQRVFNDVFVVGDLPQFDLDYSDGTPLDIAVKFKSDWWQDTMV